MLASHTQKLAWFTPRAPTGGVAGFLPAMANEEATATSPNRSGHGAKGGAQGEGAEDSGSELRIAWQYRKYLNAPQQQQQAAAGATPHIGSGARAAAQPGQRASAAQPTAGARNAAQKAVEAGVSRQWCSTYDLTRRMDPSLLSARGGLVSSHCEYLYVD